MEVCSDQDLSQLGAMQLVALVSFSNVDMATWALPKLRETTSDHCGLLYLQTNLPQSRHFGRITARP